MNFASTIVKQLESTTPFVSFEQFERIHGKQLINLGNNISPFTHSPLILDFLNNDFDNLCRKYCDPESACLREILSSMYSIQYENVLIGAGIDSLLSLITRTFLESGDLFMQLRGTYPTFSYFAIGVGAIYEEVKYGISCELSWRQLLKKVSEKKVKCLYFVHPDNPTGQYLNTEDLLEFIDSVPPQTLLILDEAYADFIGESRFNIDEIRPNLIRLRTFSKGYGLAGLRIGYAIADEGILREMNKIRIQFDTNSIAQHLALKLLQHPNILEGNVEGTKSNLSILERWAIETNHRTLKAATNFRCVDFGSEAKAKRIQLELLENHGIFTRKPSTENLASLIRFSVGTKDEMRLLTNALDKLI